MEFDHDAKMKPRLVREKSGLTKENNRYQLIRSTFPSQSEHRNTPERKPFEFPKDLEEAKSRIADLQVKLKEIHSQISNANADRPGGEDEHGEWKKKARYAQYRMRAELHQLKLWLRSEEEKTRKQAALNEAQEILAGKVPGTNLTFEIPTSEDAAERSVDSLQSEVGELQKELTRLSAAGMGKREWRTTRASVVAQLELKQAELRSVKTWLKQERRRRHDEVETRRNELKSSLDASDPSSLILHAQLLICRLARELKVKFSENDQQVLTALKQYLRVHGYSE